MVNPDKNTPAPLDPEEREIEVALDQGEYNAYMAEAAATGSWPGDNKQSQPAAPVEKSGMAPASTPKKRPRYSRRGGRSFPEISGVEVSDRIAQEEAAARGPLDEEAVKDAARLAKSAAQIIRTQHLNQNPKKD